MKKSNEKPSVNCDKTEGLLIQKHFDKIRPDQSLSVEEHLKSCERCRSYQKTLSGLQTSMQIAAEDKLAPDPAIRQNIIRRIKTVRAEEAGILARGWQYIRSGFQYRIPVYQALFGAVLIALIFFGVRQLPFSPGQEGPAWQGVARLQMPVSTEMSVIDNLEIVRQQKIGRNVKEDSTLTRFIVSTM
jgi:hypothetical protein